jgi:hypothetical protein
VEGERGVKILRVRMDREEMYVLKLLCNSFQTKLTIVVDVTYPSRPSGERSASLLGSSRGLECGALQ